jgi:hypothetical protein
MINNVSYKPQEEDVQRSQIWRMRKPENRPPSSYLTIRKLPVQKGLNMRGEIKFVPIDCSTHINYFSIRITLSVEICLILFNLGKHF